MQNLNARPNAIGNRLLSRIPQADFNRLSARMQRASFALREVVCEQGGSMDFALFPRGGVLSTVARTKDGATVEAATIGSEGMVGLGLVVGDSTSPCRVVQEVGGDLLLVPAEDLRAVWATSDALKEVLWRYAASALYQSWQNVACGLHHCVNQRLCRWLLSAADRGGDGFCATHEYLAEILGVSRQRVSIAAAMLQEEGLISYHRGTMCVTNRGGLESYSCECYRINREIYDRLMRQTAA